MIRRQFIYYGLIFTLLFGLGAVILPTWTMAQSEGVVLKTKDISRTMDPMEIRGDLLTPFYGLPTTNLILYSYRQGSFQIIPYQIDERTKDGKFIFNIGSIANTKEANRILDKQDMLAFMIEDAGDKVEQKKLWPVGVTRGLEIELTDPVNQKQGWVYLLYYQENPPATNFTPQVTMESLNPYVDEKIPFIVKGQTYTIEGMINRSRGKVYKTGVNKNFMTKKSAGGDGQNILDCMKARASFSLLFGAIKFSVNEHDMLGGIDGVRVGVVRNYGRNWAATVLPMGLRSPRFAGDIYCYGKMIIVPSRLHIPINPGYVFNDIKLSYGYDLNAHAKGMKFYNSNNLQGIVIDGRPTPEKTRMNKAVDKWRCITGPQATMVMRSDWDPRIVKQAKVEIIMEDDETKKDDPEFYPGVIGYVHNTVVVTSVERGTYDFQINWYFPENFYDPKRFHSEVIEEIMNIKNAPIEVKIENRKGKNTSGFPEPLIPKI